tara:strand:- start:1016 stop:3313 length:2298 start_codon:yes stop_codon:yes gene_type:complete
MVRFVTSFSGRHFDVYAKKMLESVVEHWADDLKLIVYYDTVTEEQKKEFPQSPIIEYRDLDQVEDRTKFLEKMKGYDGTSNGQMPYNFRMDALRFCHKVYALTDYFLEVSENEVKGGWLIWMDADVLTTSPLSEEILFEAFPKDAELIHLGRTDIDFSETGFIGFNLDTMHSHYFLADIRGCYDIGEVLAYREWTDAFIMTRFIKIYAAHGMKVHNLSEGATGLAVFPQSNLAKFMVHYKGNLKNNIDKNEVTPDVNLPRYAQLAELIRTYKPKRIVEVGTWNGGRAIEMALAAFENRDRVHYTGFDLFQDATAETDKKEQNTKPHNHFDAVVKRLEEFSEKMKEKNKTFTFSLLKGDSKETMPRAKKELKKTDFAFIDGGHSEETILSDYENLMHVPVVVLDDYYAKDADGKIPGDEFLGTNRLLETMKENSRVYVLPSQDRVKDGGTVHLMVRLKTEDLPDLPKSLSRTPIIVQPRDCVPKEEILDNINENIDLIKDWDFVQNCDIHDEHIIVASAGPSLDFEELKAVQEKNNAKIVCVKHSYPLLLEAGIQPWACVILDPRPISGTSTHGIVRTELFKEIDQTTKFFIASMTDPSVTKFIMDKTKNVYGWHAFSQAVADIVNGKAEIDYKLKIDKDNATFVSGGTCAAMRAIGMMHIFGFRNFHLFGFDCSVDGLTEEQKKEKLDDGVRPKYMPVEINDCHFWTTGELLAMAQDCEKLFDNPQVEMAVHFYGENTLVSEVYKLSRRSKPKSYMDLIEEKQAA